MVQGEMVFPRVFWIGTPYKLLGNIISDECNSSIVPNSRDKEGKNHIVFGEKNTLQCQTLGHTEENDLQLLHDKGIVKAMSRFYLNFDFSMNIAYMRSKIE